MTGPEPAGDLVPVDLAALTIPQLEQAARGLGLALAGKVRESAQAVRDARVGPVHEADTYALVRSLAAAAEVLGAVGKAFYDGAAAAEAETAEELVAVHGEQDGVPQGRIVAPCDDGTEIVVAPAFRQGGRRWDWEVLGETLTSVVRHDLISPDGRGGTTYDEAVQEAARAMLRRLVEIGAVQNPASTKVDQLASAMAASGRDRLARALHACSVPGAKTYTGVAVKREQAKTRRRR